MENNNDYYLATTKLLVDIIKEQQSFISTIMLNGMQNATQMGHMISELLSSRTHNSLHPNISTNMQEQLREMFTNHVRDTLKNMEKNNQSPTSYAIEKTQELLRQEFERQKNDWDNYQKQKKNDLGNPYTNIEYDGQVPQQKRIS